jgi:RimJ/RimL family protein N-acetyltransferase
VTRDGVVIGECAVKGGLGAGTEAEISYGLAGSERGRGTGTGLVASFSRWLLGQPGVDVVTAEVQAGNAASIRVLQKVGFTEVDGAAPYRRFALVSAPQG